MKTEGSAKPVSGAAHWEGPPSSECLLSRCLRRMICRLPMTPLLHSCMKLGAFVHLIAIGGPEWTLHLWESQYTPPLIRSDSGEFVEHTLPSALPWVHTAGMNSGIAPLFVVDQLN